MDPPSCSHLSEFRSHHGAGRNPFLSLQRCIHLPSDLPRCATCLSPTRPQISPTRLYACLSCAAVSCHSHAPAHGPPRAEEEAHGLPGGSHALAVDVDRAELFCCICQDQVYDRDFDAAVISARGQVQARNDNPEKLRPKRRRVDYRSWAPDLRERTLIGKNATPLTPSGFPWGLRGLNNLGNTCFMNSVLQALLHTPPLRNYFLSDRHNRFYCQQQKYGVKKSDVSCDKKSRVCLACDMDAMFSAVFSGDRMPYSPAKFLYSWWQHAANLASYEQQDAHEFFISMLDGIHEKAEKDKRKPQSHGSGECCITHRVFSGILRSDVMCTACGFTSTTFDPCVDVSLDLETNQGTSTKSSSTKSHNSYNGKENTKNFSKNIGMATLIGCLDRFTKPEKLGSEQKFFCQQCQVRQESLKQMSIKKLPLVSCFHIKRFEHSPIRKMSRKIDRYLQFPFFLDMGPYMSSSILRSRFGNRIFSFDGDDIDSPSELSSEFELFAVITHSGKLDSGHYVTYLRLSNQWYKCDDAWITQVNENTVRAAQGYMMFYVQKMLFYKASEKEAAL